MADQYTDIELQGGATIKNIPAPTDPDDAASKDYVDSSSAAVVSVNSQTGTVVLDADDIDDTSTTQKFASAAQLSAADSAVQPGDLATVATTGVYDDLTGKPTSMAPTAHASSHEAGGGDEIEVSVSQIDATGTASSTTYLRGDGSWNTPAGGEGGGPVAWDDVTDKPSTFPPSTHSHGVGDVTGLDEQIRDVTGTALVAGSGITVTVNDGADTITIAATGSGSDGVGVAASTIRGAWDSDETYDTDEVVIHEGTVYVALVDGVTGSDSEPGSGTIGTLASSVSASTGTMDVNANYAYATKFTVTEEVSVSGIRLHDTFGSDITRPVDVMIVADLPSDTVSWNTALADAVLEWSAIIPGADADAGEVAVLSPGVQYHIYISYTDWGYMEYGTSGGGGVTPGDTTLRYATTRSGSLTNTFASRVIAFDLLGEADPEWVVLVPASIPDPSAEDDDRMLAVQDGELVYVDPPSGGGGPSDPTPDIFMMMGA